MYSLRNRVNTKFVRGKWEQNIMKIFCGNIRESGK